MNIGPGTAYPAIEVVDDPDDPTDPGSYGGIFTIGLGGIGGLLLQLPVTIQVLEPVPPTITGVTLQPFVAGHTYQNVAVAGTNFPATCPTATLSDGGVGTNSQFAVTAGPCSRTSVQGTVTIDYHAPGPTGTLTFTWAAGFGVPPAQYNVTIVPIQMVLAQVGPTVINTANNYSEDTTISVTAVRGDTGATLTDFYGTVNVAEDTQIPGYVQIYSQNGGTLSAQAGSVTIATGGTVNFVAQSLAGPKNSTSKPDSAVLKTTSLSYPLYKGTELSVPQWIISGNVIDAAHVAAPNTTVFDWFQTHTRDVFNNAAGDTKTVLGAISTYILNQGPNGGMTNLSHSPTSSVVFNPYILAMRLNSDGGTVCGHVRPGYLQNSVIHEARHAYQGSQAVPAADADQDYLVNAPYSVAPNDVVLDTDTPRTTCDTSGGLPGVITQTSYLGDAGGAATYDAFPQADMALEEDAYSFAAGK